MVSVFASTLCRYALRKSVYLFSVGPGYKECVFLLWWS